MGRRNRFSSDVRERAVRLVAESEPQHSSQWAAIQSVAAKIGCTAETLRTWVRQAERDSGLRAGPTTGAQNRIRELERENRELRRANENLRKASAFFAQETTRPPTEKMVTFVEDHGAEFGVESICRVLPIAPSTYHRRSQERRQPEVHSDRARRDEELRGHIFRVWNDNYAVYGHRKVWRTLLREGIEVERCMVERLMRQMGLNGAVWGRTTCTTVPSPHDSLPSDLVKRNFRGDGPNRLWVADITYVAKWAGFAYVAFIVDVFSRRIYCRTRICTRGGP